MLTKYVFLANKTVGPQYDLHMETLNMNIN
jgi:hypothetical protein